MQSEPWFLLPSARDEVASMFEVASKSVGASMKKVIFSQQKEDIARFDIIGPMVRRSGFMSDFLNVPSYDWIRSSIGSLHPATKAVVLNIDSPGGQAGGLSRLTQTIERVKKDIPIIAVVDGYCCSAAMYLAASCSAIFATADSVVGSVGTRLELQDRSKLLDRVGIKTNLIVTGDFKAAGDPSQPLTDSHRAEFQHMVDALGQPFFDYVGRRRKLTEAQKKDVFQAKVYVGKDAVSAGLVDAIASPFEVMNTVRTRKPYVGTQEYASCLEHFESVLAKMKPPIATAQQSNRVQLFAR